MYPNLRAQLNTLLYHQTKAFLSSGWLAFGWLDDDGRNQVGLLESFLPPQLFIGVKFSLVDRINSFSVPRNPTETVPHPEERGNDDVKRAKPVPRLAHSDSKQTLSKSPWNSNHSIRSWWIRSDAPFDGGFVLFILSPRGNVFHLHRSFDVLEIIQSVTQVGYYYQILIFIQNAQVWTMCLRFWLKLIVLMRFKHFWTAFKQSVLRTLFSKVLKNSSLLVNSLVVELQFSLK